MCDDFFEDDFFEGTFEYPEPPEELPEWAIQQAKDWRRLDEFCVLSKAEEETGLEVDIKYTSLPYGVWGVHVVRGNRCRFIINKLLSYFWRRFALFHELHHLLYDTKGEKFWRENSYASMSSFEAQADLFAWAAIWPDWEDMQSGNYFFGIILS